MAAMLLAVAFAAGCTALTQSRQQSDDRTLLFDGARAWKHLEDQVAIGPRVAGTPAGVKTRQYIIESLAGFGIKAVEQAFDADTPIGSVRMANVIATLPGDRPERIILASHFDTKLFKDQTFVGASDGASSTAALLELARALKDKPRRFTVELLFLDGEEAFVEWSGTDHTYGSRHYVQEARRSGTLGSIRALVLLDMIGDRNLNIRRESNSTPWLTEIVWDTARRLGYGQHFLPEEMPIEDDHIEFLQAGVPAVDIIDFDYPPWHTAEDTLDKVSAKSLQIVGEVVEAALPAIEERLLKP
jgi:glutaminyl-peptide cyclotransferase